MENRETEEESQKNLIIYREALSDKLKDPTEEVSGNGIMAFVEYISDCNFNIIYPCIQLLVQHCVNVNIPDHEGITPIIKILNKDSKKLKTEYKRVIVQYLLQNAILDIDSGTNVETRTKLTEWMPGLQLPEKKLKQASNENWDYNRLMMCLQFKREDDFRRGIDIIEVNDPENLAELKSGVSGHNLLISAVVMGLTKAVEKILRVGVDINVTWSVATTWSEQVSSLPEMNALDYAIDLRYYKVVELLLRSRKLHCKKDLIFSFMKKIAKIERNTDTYKYINCFHLLLNHPNNNENDINGEDAKGLTALHYAIKYSNSTVIDALLVTGAYIGIKNNLECSLCNMNSQVLEKHLNRCITTGRDTADTGLTFCFNNLVPSQSMRKSSENLLYEMTAVELLSQANELKHLINHPLIMSFLWFKWKPLTPFFYLNFFFCTLYAVASVSYIIFCFIDDTTGSVSIKIVTLLLLSYSVLREIVQLILSPRIYLTSSDNYLDCASIVLMLIITCDLAADSWRRTVAATTIILIACEIFVSVGTLPIRSFAVHFVMLETVAKNFLKCLSLYSIIIIAFALSFYTLFSEPLLQSSKNVPTSSSLYSNDSQIESDNNGYNEFGSIGLSLVKTLVMTIGELDAGSVDFKANVASYIIFVVFILSVTTVLANLLNGLAVSDIGAVKSEAELLYLIRRCRMLARYEKVFLNTKLIKKFCDKYEIKLFTIFDSKFERSMETQIHKKQTDSYICRNIIDGALHMFSKRKVEETQHSEETADGICLPIVGEQNQHSEERADGVCREIMYRSFNMFARHKVEDDDEKAKNLFERSLGEVNEQLKRIETSNVTGNNQLNERITKIEDTLKIICDNLSEKRGVDTQKEDGFQDTN